MARSTTLQDKDNTWVVLAPCGSSEQDRVKVSFFGAITFGRVGEPDLTDDGDLKTLTTDEKNTLIKAVKAVRDLPNVTLRSGSLDGPS